MKTKNPLVEIKNVTVEYGANMVLSQINLIIEKGEFLGVIGPNGSGKTTLLKTMLGLVPPSEGSVSLFRKPLPQFNHWHKIGYVPQKAGSGLLKFPLTVWEAVSLGRLNHSRWFDFETAQDEALIKKSLESVGMYEHKDRRLGELSGGQQQRVFIAKALASEPELLVLDEPTVGIDAESQVKFYQLLRMLNRDMELTLILVSHDIDVVAHEVQTIACINRTLVSHGTPQKILQGDVMHKLYGDHVRRVIHEH